MTVLSLHFLAKTVVVQILIDYEDSCPEYRQRAQNLIRQLQTEHFASVSVDLLETLTENYPSAVSDELLCVLSPPHLRRLHLVGFNKVKDVENLHHLFRKCSKIESLSLDGCEGLVNIELCYFLCKTLTHLTSVTMESCPPITDEHVQFLLLYCPSLTHLNIAWNEDITDNVFNLKSLAGQTSSSSSQQDGVEAPNLHSVNVSGCRSLTSNCIRYLAKLCGSKLQSLNVSYTQMDTSILWYLSGFNLATAVQLAVSQDGEVLDRTNIEEKLIADLVVTQKTMQDELDCLKLKEELQNDLECGVDGSSSGGGVATNDGIIMNSANVGGGCLTGEDDQAATQRDRSEVGAGQVFAEFRESEQIDAMEEARISQPIDAMNEYLEELGVARTTDDEMVAGNLSSERDSLDVHHHSANSELTGTDDGRDAADRQAISDVDIGDVHFAIRDIKSSDMASKSVDSPSSSRNPSSLSVQLSSTSTGLAKSDTERSLRSSSVDAEDISAIKVLNDDLGITHRANADAIAKRENLQAVERTRLFQPNMTSLDISNISLEAPLADSALREFFAANQNMKRFSVSWSFLNNFTLEFIANHAPELRYLSLIDCESLSSAGIVCLTKCKHLEHLDLKDAGLAPLLTREDSALKFLCLAEANITDSTMLRVSKYLGNKIHDLDISWCEEVTDTGIGAVVHSCTSLQSLSLRQCPTSDQTLLCLADNCTKLTDLNLCGVGDLGDEVVIALAKQLSVLEKIDLSWNPNLTDVSISKLLLCCTLMKEAILCGLKRITSKPFLPIIAEYRRWKRCKGLLTLKLKERKLLEVTGDPHLSSDEEFEDLYIPHRSTAYSPCLRLLDVEYCNQINDDLIAEIVAVCVGTLKVRDYYGQQVEPKLLRFR